MIDSNLLTQRQDPEGSYDSIRYLPRRRLSSPVRSYTSDEGAARSCRVESPSAQIANSQERTKATEADSCSRPSSGIPTNQIYVSQPNLSIPDTMSGTDRSLLSKDVSDICLSHAKSDGGRTYTTSPIPLPQRRLRNCQENLREVHEAIVAQGNVLKFLGLSPSTTNEDVYEAILRMGFKPQYVTALSLSPGDAASVEFAHSSLANTAYSLFCQTPPVWLLVNDRISAIATGPERLNKRTHSNLDDVIDLTQDEDILHTPPSSADDHLLGGLSTSVYNDSDSDIEILSNASSTPQIPPLPVGVSDDFPGMLCPSDLEMTADPQHLRPQLPQKGSACHVSVGPSRTQVLKGATSSRVVPDALPTFSPPRQKVQKVTIPHAPHNYARRVLLPANLDLPLLTVSMRADVHFFDRKTRHRISRHSLPNAGGYRHVVDAVMTEDTALIAYGDGPCQVSFTNPTKDQRPRLTDISHNPHRRINAKSARHHSCTAALSSITVRSSTHNKIQFFTGGYDKSIRLWSISDLSTAVDRALFPASSDELTRLIAVPDALAFRDCGQLSVACSKAILTLDLGHLTQRTTKVHMSNAIHQIHVHKQAPSITILEVDNLDFQIQLYDDRKKRGFDRAADCSFGGRFGSNPLKRSSRGDSDFDSRRFVKGYQDGTICIWDYRSAKRPVHQKQSTDLGQLNHTIFSSSHVVGYGRNGVTFVGIDVQ